MTAKTILVIDDDRDLREVVADVLNMHGYEVWTAEHGAAALERLEGAETLPSLILLDMMMPVMNGWAFAEEKAKSARLAAIPFIAFTAHVDSSEAANVVGAKLCLKKPFGMDELLETIERALR
jgi:two-component system, chemotaxis family, chemotaxis protein CheY